MATFSCRACGESSPDKFFVALDRVVHVTRAHVGRVCDESSAGVDLGRHDQIGAVRPIEDEEVSP
jgi:hypothetical protein